MSFYVVFISFEDLYTLKGFIKFSDYINHSQRRTSRPQPYELRAVHEPVDTDNGVKPHYKPSLWRKEEKFGQGEQRWVRTLRPVFLYSSSKVTFLPLFFEFQFQLRIGIFNTFKGLQSIQSSHYDETYLYLKFLNLKLNSSFQPFYYILRFTQFTSEENLQVLFINDQEFEIVS